MLRAWPLLLALPAAGCIGLSEHPARDLDYEVLDPQGRPLEEWWVLSWRSEQETFCGLWTHWDRLTMWPESTRIARVQLRRMTPSDRTIRWPASYDLFVNWGFLILPPGSACRARTELRLFAAGHPWGWHYRRGGGVPAEAVGDPLTGRWRVHAEAAARPEPGTRLDRSNAASSLHELPDLFPLLRGEVGLADLKAFIGMLVANLETLSEHTTLEGGEARRALPQLRALRASLD